MRSRLLLAVAALLSLAACGESTTAPRSLTPVAASFDVDPDQCRTGYHVATRADGTTYCEAGYGGRSAP